MRPFRDSSEIVHNVLPGQHAYNHAIQVAMWRNLINPSDDSLTGYHVWIKEESLVFFGDVSPLDRYLKILDKPKAFHEYLVSKYGSLAMGSHSTTSG